MRQGSITDQNIASRRGLLLGMTLAEVMLIVLFCLLLLLGKYHLDYVEEKKRSESFAKLVEDITAQNLTVSDLPELAELYQKFKKLRLPGEMPNETWKRLTDAWEKMQLWQAGDDDETGLREKVDEQRKRIGDLRKVIAEIKAGSPPPCLHRRPANKNIVKGASIQLGVVHIENGRMTLVEKNRAIPSLEPVDFVGDDARYEEAYRLLMAWPEDRPLTLPDFDRYARDFVRIGDDVSDDKLKCRFTMSYYIEDRVPHDMLVKEFMRYFYLQHKLSKNEFERRR